MSEKVFDMLWEQAEKVYTPLNKLSTTYINNIEKMVNFQITAMESYSEFMLEQIRSAAQIKDADTMNQFFSQQAEMVGKLNKKFIEDERKFSDINKELKEELESTVQSIWETNSQTAATSSNTKSSAEPAPKTSSRKKANPTTENA